MAKTRFHALLEQRVSEAVDQRMKSLAAGSAQDYAEYRLGVGYVQGLQDALKLCEDIEKENE